ncbi:MAG: hypothetical protein ABIH20_01870 [Candidatus Diapherotrites archaeon]
MDRGERIDKVMSMFDEHGIDSYYRGILVHSLERCESLYPETINRIKRALEICDAGGFAFSLYSRLRGDNSSIPEGVNGDLVLTTFLGKLEQVRLVAEGIMNKARKAGLNVKFGRLSFLAHQPFPALIVGDAKGKLFWTVLEPEGKSLEVRYIQGIECRKLNKEPDNAMLFRLQEALKSMGYPKLRDGVFNDICGLSRGRFNQVHYTSPRADRSFHADHGPFHALVRRLGLTKTPRRATRVL